MKRVTIAALAGAAVVLPAQPMPSSLIFPRSRSRPSTSATRPTCWRARAATSPSRSAPTASSWSTRSSRRCTTRSRPRSRKFRRCRSSTWSTPTIMAITPTETRCSTRKARPSWRTTISVSASLAGTTNLFNGNKAPPAPADAIPTMTYQVGDMKLPFGGRTVELRHVINAHTDGDTWLYFPDANVLSLGDTFSNGRYPNIDWSNGGGIDGMIARQRALPLGGQRGHQDRARPRVARHQAKPAGISSPC